MKGVYTQWTAPATTSPIIKDKYSGFSSFESFLWSWILSVNLAKKRFDALDLYCDTEAKNILIHELQLPFDNIHVTLDNKKEYTNIWAYGKMHTYMQQTEPFVHIDADLYLYKRLDFELQYPYFFWAEECKVKDNGVYIDGYRAISKLSYVPQVLKDNPANLCEDKVVNVGLMCIQDPQCPAYQEYIKELNLFFETNKHAIAQDTPQEHGGSSVVIEQFLLSLLLKKHSKPYHSYGQLGHSFPYQGSGNKCIHFVGPSKLTYSHNIKQRAIMLTGKKYINIVKQLTHKYS